MLRRSVLLLCAALAACPRPTPSRSELPSRARDTDAQGFYAQPAGLADDFPEESTGEEKVRRVFATTRAAGSRYLRFAVGWDGVETAPGVYDWRLWDQVFREAASSGVVPLPYVCYTPKWLNPDPTDYWRRPPEDMARFGRFMETISRRYSAPSWELWNEPDNDFYWLGTVGQFIALVEEGAAGVHRGDPRAKVVLGGMSKGRSPFLERTLLAVAPVIGAVNLHGYFETWDERRAEDYPRYIGDVSALVQEAAPRADLWLAEFGYSDWLRPDGRPSEWSYALDPWEHTPAFQGVALLRAHALALGTAVLSLTTWYRVDDLAPGEGVIGDENNKRLGLLDVRGARKPAFTALALWNRLFTDATRPVRAEAAGAMVRAFERKSGGIVVLAWLPSARRGDPPRSAEAVVSIELPGRASEVDIYDPSTGERAGTGTLSRIRLRADSIFVGVVPPGPANSPDRGAVRR
jgi:hypothetical protein